MGLVGLMGRINGWVGLIDGGRSMHGRGRIDG